MIIVWNMEKFQFHLLTYHWGPKFFLGLLHQIFLQLCLGVVVFKTCLFNTWSHFTLTALYRNFFLSCP